MAGWNGSDRKGAAPVQPKVTAKKPSPIRGLIAGGAVVVLAAVAYFAFFSGGEEAQKVRSTKDRGKIKEVTPAAAPKYQEEVKVEKEKPKKPHYWEQPTTNGLTAAQIRKWKHVRVPPPSYTNNAMLLRPKSHYEIFETRAENEIAMLMTIEPGAGLVGSPNYGEAFKKEFLKSCETPIIVKEDDSEHDKQLKRDMIQTKIELRQRMADGEDICQIMTDARLEAMRLGQIKQEIESQAHDLFKEAKTEEDLDDSIAAANKMLESKGIAPIKMSPMLRRNLIRKMQNN